MVQLTLPGLNTALRSDYLTFSGEPGTMAGNSVILTELYSFEIQYLTVTFENSRLLRLCNCGGSELLCLDLSLQDVHVEVDREQALLRIGPPGILPLGSQQFTTALDINRMGTSVVFAKHLQSNDFDFVGTEDVRYQCVVNPTPNNGYRQYRYILSKCRISLRVQQDTLYICCECENGACNEEPHSGFRVLEALKWDAIAL